ncbi:MAG: lipopolysaccharide assembly protein LapA domain-containing protein [Rhodoplanes sp.]
MMRRALAIFVLFPLAIVIVALAVANRQTVAVSFDPFSMANPAYVAQSPLFLLVFLLVIAGVLIGGTAAWLRQGRWRRRARRLESRLNRAEAEMERLKRRAGLTGDAGAPAPSGNADVGGVDRRGDTRPPPRWPPPRALPPAA